MADIFNGITFHAVPDDDEKARVFCEQHEIPVPAEGEVIYSESRHRAFVRESTWKWMKVKLEEVAICQTSLK